jgi:hypothetical protein
MLPKEHQTDAQIKAMLRNLSQKDFKSFGVPHLAYIRPVFANNRVSFAVHAADGDRLSVLDSFQEAVIAAKLNDLEPVSVQ